ncbi:MAG: DnaB-like helicase C-terminal domain-containing protein [Melioribacteraceae bacterium]|nr:DnaB-like helicase C-terminal domain-containing protein [Melioribacteraceae bacterium]
MLSHLRESGSIEQDADVVLFLYRPEAYEIEQYQNGESTEGVAEVIIGKQRNGPIGDVKLQFIKDYARFENRELFRTQLPEATETSAPPPEQSDEDWPI